LYLNFQANSARPEGLQNNCGTEQFQFITEEDFLQMFWGGRCRVTCAGMGMDCKKDCELRIGM